MVSYDACFLTNCQNSAKTLKTLTGDVINIEHLTIMRYSDPVMFVYIKFKQ